MYIGDFKIHRISTNYVRYLSQYDINVKYNEKNKRTRIYLGVGVTIDKIRYFVPLCSPDEKSKFLRMNETTDFMKIQDKNNKLLCVLNISSTIPVPESEIVYVDFKLESTSYSYLLHQ